MACTDTNSSWGRPRLPRVEDSRSKSSHAATRAHSVWSRGLGTSWPKRLLNRQIHGRLSSDFSSKAPLRHGTGSPSQEPAPTLRRQAKPPKPLCHCPEQGNPAAESATRFHMCSSNPKDMCLILGPQIGRTGRKAWITWTASCLAQKLSLWLQYQRQQTE